MDAEFDIRKN